MEKKLSRNEIIEIINSNPIKMDRKYGGGTLWRLYKGEMKFFSGHNENAPGWTFELFDGHATTRVYTIEDLTVIDALEDQERRADDILHRAGLITKELTSGKWPLD